MHSQRAELTRLSRELEQQQERLMEQAAKLDYQHELFEKTSQAIIDKNHEDHEDYTTLITEL